MPTDKDRPKTIKFTIDGRHFTVTDHTSTAADLLQLAGLDPNDYDLAEVRPGHGDPKRYEDHEPVRIHEGDKFVTIPQRAEVA